MQPYHHFTLDERESLYEKRIEGKSIRQIAREMERSPSSISREVKRNWSSKANRYHPWRATVLYIQRRKACVRQPRLADTGTREFVVAGLGQHWSPEIIAQRWNMKHPDQPLYHSTIYRGLRNKLFPGFSAKTHLRRRGKGRSNNYAKVFHPKHTIHDRPPEANDRIRLGDLEGDTVYGGIAKGCLVTLVDRTSRFLYAALSVSREKTVITKAIGDALGCCNPLTITFDNGSEFADYPNIEKNHDTTVYFADPHSPWQRGSNENINGLLRFFFPKGTDFLSVSPLDLSYVLSLINNRPRKCLGWLSPLEFLNARCT